MFTTSLTLIGRLREPADADAWAQFVALYAPLLRAWVRPLCGQDADADDVIQEVLVVVVRRLPEFAHSRRMGAFRTWLKAVAKNKLGADVGRSRVLHSCPSGQFCKLARRFRRRIDVCSGCHRIAAPADFE